MSQLDQIQQQVQGIPGYGYVMDKFNDYAGDRFNSLDPYDDENGKRRNLGPNSTPQEQKLWKTVQKKAWLYDKCFLGSCGVGMDCGLGLAPLVVFLFPGLGPLLMYVVHNRLISIVEREIQLPGKMLAQIQGEIFFELLITFPPIIGSFFSWLHGCSTRNATLIYKYMESIGEQRSQNNLPTYAGTSAPTYQAPPKPKKAYNSRQNNGIVQGEQTIRYT